MPSQTSLPLRHRVSPFGASVPSSLSFFSLRLWSLSSRPSRSAYIRALAPACFSSSCVLHDPGASFWAESFCLATAARKLETSSSRSPIHGHLQRKESSTQILKSPHLALVSSSIASKNPLFFQIPATSVLFSWIISRRQQDEEGTCRQYQLLIDRGTTQAHRREVSRPTLISQS